MDDAMQMKGSGSQGGMAGMQMGEKRRATVPQIVSVTLLSVLALAAGVVLSGAFGDFAMSAKTMSCDSGRFDMSLRVMPMTMQPMRVCNLIMPPGMIMTQGQSVQALRDMAAVDPAQVRSVAPVGARGDRTLRAQVVGGVKVYRLTVSLVRWSILPGTQVNAYAFNGTVPGPRIRLRQGDRVRFIVTNRLPEPTSVHWHGLIVPNRMDGPAYITQRPIPPGGRFVYSFRVTQQGTFFYHSHTSADRQQGLGMYGALIIDPRTPPARKQWDRETVVQLGEWTVRDGYTFPSMPMEGALPNFFTIEGKSYPSTPTIRLKVGQRLLVRFIGTNDVAIHPMHIHGGPFRIVATDGNPVPRAAQLQKDTVDVGPGERYDVIWTARRPGRWLLHCHINHHTTNDNVETQGAGGLTEIIDVTK